MVYGYARVSTRGQAKDGNSLEDQEQKLRAAGCEEVVHDSVTGTKMDRPAFSRLYAQLKPGDTLVVTKLDRFARTAADGAKAIQALVERGVDVNVLNMGRADNSPMGKLMVTVLLAFAEFERDQIVERTAAGKAVARATKPGWREGRREVELPDLGKYRALVADGKLTVTESCRRLGISRRTWYNKGGGRQSDGV